MADKKGIISIILINLYLLLITMNISCKVKPEIVFNDSKVIEFISVVKKGDMKKTEQLIAGGFDIDSENKNGITALYYFFLERDFKSFERCLELGANPNVAPVGLGMFYLLNAAMDINDQRYFDLLIKFNVDINYIPATKTSGRSPIKFAMFTSVKPVYLEKLLKKGVNPVNIDSFIENPLFFALSGREYKKVKLLLEYYPEYLNDTKKFKLKGREKTIKEMFIEDLESYTQFKGSKLYFDQLELVKFLKDKFGIELTLKY
jgi:ankyrin repeat protein